MSNTTTNGRIIAVKKNDYGFYAFRIGEAWYNAGKKFEFEKGDVVEFDFYLKDEKWKTVKGDIRKLSSGEAAAAEKTAPKGAYSSTRDDYWTKKGERDITVVEPRITYLAAVERAIAFTSLCIANGALDLAKVKQADKMDVLQAFVDEHTLRIANYAMNITAAPHVAAPAKEEPKVVAEDDPEKWS